MRGRILAFLTVQCVALAACATVSAQSSFPGKLPNCTIDGQFTVFQLSTHTWVCHTGGGGGGDVTASGTLTNNAIILGGGTTVVKATTTGTGVVTALGVNTNSAGGFVTSPVPVANGGTALTSGTSGGVLAFTASGTIASSGALTANLPVIGGGAGAAPTVGTRSGNTVAFVTTTGAQTSGDCVKIDANGNHIANGSACGSGTPGGSDTQVQFNDSSAFGGDAGLVFNKTSNVLTTTGALVTAGLNNAYVTKTGNYTATATDRTIELLTNAGTITLPTAVGIQGRIYTLKNLQTANALTIATASSQTVDGAAPGTISNGCLDIQSDGANWRIIGACGLPLSTLTSGGVIYASSTTAVASSALLAANGVVQGGGAGTAPFTVAGIFTDGTSKLTLGQAGTSAGGLVFSNATSGTITVSPPTGALGTIAITIPATAGTLITSASSVALPFHVMYNAGVSQAGTASVGLSTPATLGATAISQNGAAGGNAAYGVASFLNTEIDEIQGHFPLPSDWSSGAGIDLQIKWRAISTTANDVRFQIRTKCVATGEADTAVSYNTAQSTAAVTNLTTTLQWNSSSQTGLTLTGCSAGEEFFFILSRDTSVSGDTLDQPVQVAGLDFVYRRLVLIGG